MLGTVPSALGLADALLRKAPVRVSVLYLTDGGIYSYREDYTNPVINQSDPHDLSRRFRGACTVLRADLTDAAELLRVQSGDARKPLPAGVEIEPLDPCGQEAA